MDRVSKIICCLLLFFCCLSCPGAEAGRRAQVDESGDRDGRIFSMFQIIRFPNEPCAGSDGKNGTCYTESECSDRNGAKSGSCASGYGVCCVFNAVCGSQVAENCTYFSSNGMETGNCGLSVCKCQSDICQLRLDFNTFMIAGPTTSTVTDTNVLHGVPTAGGTAAVRFGNCDTDQFTVTNPGGTGSRVICGTNTGEHMYVDASDLCNELNFGLGASTANRQWSIKVTQYSCNFENLAPRGCEQYYFGSNTDTVMTYNFAGGVHLANQDQNICVRREMGNCRICWTAALDTDVEVASIAAGVVTAQAAGCCANHGAGGALLIFDCVMIPGGRKDTAMSMLLPFDGQCGREKGLVTSAGGENMTVCSRRQPFNIRFISDSVESADESKLSNKGFKLTYIQSSTGC